MNRFFKTITAILLTLVVLFGANANAFAAYPVDPNGFGFKRFGIQGTQNMGILACHIVPGTGSKMIELWVDAQPRPAPGAPANSNPVEIDIIDAEARVQGVGSAQNIDLGGVVNPLTKSFLKIAFFNTPPNGNSSVLIGSGYARTSKSIGADFIPQTVFVDCPSSPDGDSSPLKVAVLDDNEFQGTPPKPVNLTTPEPGWGFNLRFPSFDLPDWLGIPMMEWFRQRA